MSCKDFFPSEDAETFSPLEQRQTFLRHPQFLPRFLPQAPVETAGVDFFPEMRSRNLYFIGSGCTFPPGPPLLCLQDGRKVVVSEGRGAALVLCPRSACSGAVGGCCLFLCSPGSPAFLAGEYIQGFPLNNHRPWEHFLVSKIKI